MRIEKHHVLSCLLVILLSITLGCSKKETGGTPASGTGTGGPTPAVSADVQKPVPEVQAQADTMSVENLRAMALKYKEAILAKQTEIQKVADKLKEIPVADALGQEAKQLKTDLQNLETSLKALKDRFQVYYDTLKTKGGDLSGLTA